MNRICASVRCDTSNKRTRKKKCSERKKYSLLWSKSSSMDLFVVIKFTISDVAASVMSLSVV